MTVTIKQIAEQAGVSRGTVDRVLNDRGKVRPEVEQRVRKIADELGYRPNLLGRALGMSKKNIKIGVILQAAGTPFMKAVFKGAEGARAEVESLGGTVIYKKLPEISAEQTVAAMEEMRAAEVNAIALMPAEGREVNRAIDLFAGEYEIPIVTFNSDVIGTKRLCFIGQNAVNCGRTAAGLLGEFFRRTGGKIAVISGDSTNTSHSSRVLGFAEALKRESPGITILGPSYCHEKDELAEEQTEKFLQTHSDLSGIYITSHGEQGVCRALKRHRLDQKIIMVASDLMGKNYEFLKEGTINLLIGQEAYAQGYDPIMILYRLLFKGEKPQREYYYTDIVIKTRYNI